MSLEWGRSRYAHMRGAVQHCNHRVQDIARDLKPHVESVDQLFSNILARIGQEIVVWPEKDLATVCPSVSSGHTKNGAARSNLSLLIRVNLR